MLFIILPSVATASTFQQIEMSVAEEFLIPDSSNTIIKTYAPVKHSTYQQTYRQIYGPIRNNEGLWDISEQLRIESSSDFTTPQMAVALFENNPKAFREQNINGLLVGALLKIPDQEQISKRSKEDAFSLFLQHWEIWKKTEVQADTVFNSEQIEKRAVNNTTLPDESVQKPVVQKTIAQKPVVQKTIAQKPVVQRTIAQKPVVQKTIAQKPVVQKNLIKEVITQKTVTQMAAFKIPELKKNAIKPEQPSVPLEKQLKPIISSNNVNTVPHKVQTEQHTSNNNQLALYSQSQLNFIYQETLQNISKIILYIKHDLISPTTNKDVSIALASFPAVPVLIGLSLLAFLIVLYRWQKIDLSEIDSPEAYVQHSTSETNDIQLAKKITHSNDLFWMAEQDDEKTSNDMSDSITDPVDIKKFITHTHTKTNRKGKNVLEAAFGNKIHTKNNVHTRDKKAEVQPDTEKRSQNSDSTDTYLSDSVEEIRFVNETTRDSTINAFFDITQSENLAVEMLTCDINDIESNEKIDIFIQEFDDILVNLTQSATAISQNSNELENILQFKLSVHFIKILSEMMQASHLEKFSNTVIDFLEDILVGHTQMSSDIGDRLIVVIGAYKDYIHSVKENHINSIEA